MIVNLLVAALAGILIPLGLYALDLDPAIASGVFVTTVTDVVGFFAFLGLARFVVESRRRAGRCSSISPRCCGSCCSRRR